MYGNGEGVLQDNVYSHMWFNIASSNGSETTANLDPRGAVEALLLLLVSCPGKSEVDLKIRGPKKLLTPQKNSSFFIRGLVLTCFMVESEDS